MASDAIIFKDAALRKSLEKLIKEAETVSNVGKDYARSIAPIVYGDIIKHFEGEQGPDGKWKAWSKAYAAHMAKQGKSGNKILQDTGNLRQSFTPASYRASKKGILFFNPVEYAAKHDEGDPSKKLPQREFMWLSDKGTELVAEATLDFMLRNF